MAQSAADVAKPPQIPTLRRESSRNLMLAKEASGEKPGERYPNMFLIPHKAFRVMFFETFEKIGNVNFLDDEDLAECQKMVNHAVFVYSHHNEEESGFFGTRLAERDPSLVEQWNEDHNEHRRVLESFKGRMEQIVNEKDVGKREKALATLYVDFGNYVSADLAHMSFEENKVMQSYWKNFTDDELRAMEMEFVKTINPEFMQAAIPFIMRAHNVSTRINLLKMLQHTGTPEEHVRALVGLISRYAKPNEVAHINKVVFGAH